MWSTRRRCQDGEYVYVEVEAQRVERLPSGWTTSDASIRRDHSRRAARCSAPTISPRLAEIVAAVACAERAPRDGGGKKHA